MKLSIAGVIAAMCVCIVATPVSANHVKDVLGDTTTAPSDIKFPTIAAGPGLFLPDSPLYFLDNIAQGLKVLVAFSPERKAQIRTQIAGERLAELRVMLERNNEEGIERALENFANESELAGESMSDAGVRSGEDIKPVAKEVNTTLKEYRNVLKELEKQSSGELRLRIKAAREALKAAKVEVEDELPEDELAKEVEENLNEAIEDEVIEASRSARGLEHAINVLEKLASQAAEKNQTAREAALRRAIEKKNETLLRQEEKRVEREKRKDQKRLERNMKAIEDGKEAAKRALEAALKFEKSKLEAENESELEKQLEEESSGRGNSGKSNDNFGKGSSRKN